MRTTVDLPEPLFRRTKALAALRGTSMKELIVHALEKEVDRLPANNPAAVEFPLVRLGKGRKVDLTGFDFDDLLA
jgi:hypothetical protein